MTLPAGFVLDNDGPSFDEMVSYTREAAQKRRLDPDQTVKAFSYEGLKPGVWQSQVPRQGRGSYNGLEDSWGPTQLYMGGGLGNEFQRRTGLDPRDKSTWKDQIDFSLDHIASNNGSLKEWYGPRSAGIDRIGFLDVDENAPRLGAIGSPVSQAIPDGFVLDGEQSGSPEPQQQADESGVSVGGMAKAFLSGVPRGGAYIAGLGGDVRSYLAKGFEAATGVELPSVPRGVMRAVAPALAGPTSDQLLEGIDQAGLSYQPKNTAEQYAQTAGEFLPAMMTGPVNSARTLAGRGGEALLRSAAAGTAVETAGSAAGAIDPRLEAPAKFVAAMVAGGPRSIKRQRAKVHSTEEWGKVADDAYASLDNLEAGLSPVAMKRVLVDTATKLSKQNFDPQYHTTAVNLLQRMGRIVKQNRPVRFPELQNIRTEAGALTGANDPSARFVKTFKDAIDDAWATAKPSDFVGKRPLSAQEVRDVQKSVVTAREAYFMKKKGELLDGMVSRINGRAENFSVSGFENAVKTEARQILTKISRNTPAGRRLKATFTPEQIKRLERMRDGKNIGDIIKIAKKYGASNSISTSQISVGSAVMAAIMGDVTPLLVGGAVIGTGSAAKAIANRRAKRTFDDFGDTLRGGQPAKATFDARVPLLYGASQRPVASESQ